MRWRVALLLLAALLSLASCKKKPAAKPAVAPEAAPAPAEDREEPAVSYITPGPIEIDESLPYEEYLAKLPKDNPSAISLAVAKFKACAGQDKIGNDALFRQLYDFYISVNVKIEEQGLWSYREEDLNANGIRVGYSEAGDFALDVPEFFSGHLKEYLSDGLAAYLAICDQESAQTDTYLIEDAGLSISWDELSDRIIAWERYLETYPDYPEARGAKFDARQYLKLYLADIGLDNTPMFEGVEQVLDEELRWSYERFLANSRIRPPTRRSRPITISSGPRDSISPTGWSNSWKSTIWPGTNGADERQSRVTGRESVPSQSVPSSQVKRPVRGLLQRRSRPLRRSSR